MDVLYPAYREHKRIGSQHLNRSKFHSRLLRIAYGIINGLPAWASIPSASVIGDSFGTPAGVSFAFMNISKLSKKGAGWQSAFDVIRSAYELSTRDRNFISEEVFLLRPHIIISMKLNDMVSALGQRTPNYASPLVQSFCLDVLGHRTLLIETYHFSALRKRAFNDLYEPICEAIRRNEFVLNTD